MWEVKTSSVPETEALGQKIASALKGGEVIALFGPMGMGKTALTRGIAQGLGVNQGVCSPTFALMHQYRGKFNIYHFDMFRVEGWDDLYTTGFFDFLDTGGVLIVEWSENIENALPENSIRIHLQQGSSENERIFQIEGMQQL